MAGLNALGQDIYVREYDATRLLPEYYVLLDEYFYESNAGRKWMSVLENPLATDVSLPPAYAGRIAKAIGLKAE